MEQTAKRKSRKSKKRRKCGTSLHVEEAQSIENVLDFNHINFPDISELGSSNASCKKNIFTMHSKMKACSVSKISITDVHSILNLLDNEIKLSKNDQQLKDCLGKMHVSKPAWKKPSTVMKAIKHSILTKKWNNLTYLLLMLINFPTDRYRVFIRHMCQLIDHQHHLIEDAGLEGQIQIVNQAHRRRQLSRGKN